VCVKGRSEHEIKDNESAMQVEDLTDAFVRKWCVNSWKEPDMDYLLGEKWRYSDVYTLPSCADGYDWGLAKRENGEEMWFVIDTKQTKKLWTTAQSWEELKGKVSHDWLETLANIRTLFITKSSGVVERFHASQVEYRVDSAGFYDDEKEQLLHQKIGKLEEEVSRLRDMIEHFVNEKVKSC
jgi:hypothetical protein